MSNESKANTILGWLKDTAEMVGNIFDAKETIVALAAGLALGIAISAGFSGVTAKATATQTCDKADDQKLNDWLQKKSNLKW